MVEGTKTEAPNAVGGQGVFPTSVDAYPLADGAYITPAVLGGDLGVGTPDETLCGPVPTWHESGRDLRAP